MSELRADPGTAVDLRADGHAAIEWAASYLERVGELPVLAQVAPGEIRSRLPARAPDEPEPFADVLRDLDEVLLPGVTHWQHPRFFAYFAMQFVRAGDPGRAARRDAQLDRDPVAYRAGRDRARGRGARLGG